MSIVAFEHKTDNFPVTGFIQDFPCPTAPPTPKWGCYRTAYVVRSCFERGACLDVINFCLIGPGV